MSFLACNVLLLLMAQCLPINRIAASFLDSITISRSDILKTISSLDINKAHGHDDISIRMLKICNDAIVEPLKILFVNSVNQAVFPSRWKKANVIHVHKKNEKYIVNNYRPVSLLPIASKIFEKAIYHNLLNYIELENLLNINQSVFRIQSHLLKKSLTEIFIFYAAYSVNVQSYKCNNRTKETCCKQFRKRTVQ